MFICIFSSVQKTIAFIGSRLNLMYPPHIRCAVLLAQRIFFRSASLIRMITVSKVCKLTLLRMLQPLTDRLKHSRFIAVTHP